jgi:uncharacterized protein
VKAALALIAIASAFVATPASAQSAVASAIQSGQAGERYDGYLGVVGNGPSQLQRQVSAVNIQRRKLYIELAQRRGVTPDLVGMATACQLFSKLSAGQAYMQADGVWRRRAPGQTIALPDYCR